MKIIKVLLLIIVLFIAGAHEIYSDAGSGSTSIVVNVVPTVSGQNVSSITATGATLGANVTSLGVPAAISARGTCWGSSTNPTTNCVSAGGTTTGTYSHARSGMSCNTAYYYRGYATNTTGTGYSTTSSFTTSACPLPTPTNFTATTGACGTTTLTLSWNASAGATAYVLYRNGTAAPISSGSSSTSFTDTGLTAGTTYTYRVSAVGPQPQSAEATTSGTVAAACPANAVPTVTTPTVSSITTTGATLGANVTNLGYPASISARGTCWGSSNNPTTNCASASGTTTGTYSHSRTGMSCNTLYYYRGYATNTTGTGYSASSSFTTSACPVMSGTISSSASSCTISAGSSSCNVTIDWSTTNAVATSAVTASGMTSVNGNSGSQAMAVPYSSRTFY
ncbi:MAG TPA: hypothetical protein VK153_03815, partial [Candidatus Paceibacterota bacterium]|nr:hypothetical protein [Candidatus Paceibacterota bacterium]